MLTKPVIHSFPPLAGKNARVVVLGSMPGAESLRQQQYYAHSRNAFWPIMADIVGCDVNAPYKTRAEAIRQSKIAVWDVLHSCTREGSLDSAIADDVPNDFAGFFKKHPAIETVCFNGGKAQSAFKKYVLPDLPDQIKARLTFIQLPSTSMAHASMRPQEKARIWKKALQS